MFRHFRMRRSAGLLVLIVATVAGVSAYAFTASNTVSAHKAGAGTGAVTGYTVTQTSYTWNAAGTRVTEVAFTLSAAASDVKVALTAGVPVLADWTGMSGNSGVCTISGVGSDTVSCTMDGTGIVNANALNLAVAAVSAGTVVIA